MTRNRESSTASEAYTVTFWRKVGQYWRQEAKTYLCHGKGSHAAAQAQWRREFAGKRVRLVSVIYN